MATQVNGEAAPQANGLVYSRQRPQPINTYQYIAYQHPDGATWFEARWGGKLDRNGRNREERHLGAISAVKIRVIPPLLDRMVMAITQAQNDQLRNAELLWWADHQQHYAPHNDWANACNHAHTLAALRDRRV